MTIKLKKKNKTRQTNNNLQDKYFLKLRIIKENK